MIPTQAAKLIGCTAAHVRSLIRSGKIRAKKKPDPHYTNRKTGEVGFYYEISEAQVRKAMSLPCRSTRGRSRKSA